MRRLTRSHRLMSRGLLIVSVIGGITLFLHTQWAVDSWNRMKSVRSTQATIDKNLRIMDFQPRKVPINGHGIPQISHHSVRMREHVRNVNNIPFGKHPNATEYRKVRFAPHKGDPTMHILSAFGSDSDNPDGYATNILLNGWMYNDRLYDPIKCCILWRDDSITMIRSPKKVKSQRSRTAVLGRQISCPFDNSLQNVTGVTIQFTNKSCPTKTDELYVKPNIPEKTVDQDSFALCLKIVYGHIDNAQLIDWLEFHREIKVDKVFMFTYNVTEATHDVIKHYVDMGFVETRYLDYPLKSKFPNLSDKKPAIWEIKRTVIYDCFQRSTGYKYMAVVDMDEFLLPRRHRHIKDLMKHVMKKHPAAAGFMLPTCIFDKNLKPDTSAPVNATDVMKYVQRTPPSHHARPKCIILPSRTGIEGLYTHDFKPNRNYERIFMESSDATINHYRHCYHDLRKKLCDARNTIVDRDIQNIMGKLKNRIWKPVI